MSKGHDAVAIVCSADGGYVLPLTVMLVSVRTHLPARRHLDVHIIDDGIPELEKARLRRSLDVSTVTISWHKPDRSRLVGVPLWGRMPLCTYNKLLVPDVLPEETIEDEVSGLLFPNGDELALHRALERIATGAAFPSHSLDPDVVARVTRSVSIERHIAALRAHLHDVVGRAAA